MSLIASAIQYDLSTNVWTGTESATDCRAPEIDSKANNLPSCRERNTEGSAFSADLVNALLTGQRRADTMSTGSSVTVMASPGRTAVTAPSR